jgi:hypothetical protein
MPRAQEIVTAIWLGLVLFGAGRLHAQGVTGAAMQGTITGADSAVVQGASVLITNTATGERWRTATNANGRFFVEHLSLGGPYRIEVNAIGFAPASQNGIFLSLGERHTTAFNLRHVAVELAELTVQAAVDPLINSGRTGPAQIVSDSTMLRLPSHRDYTDLARLAPQVNYGSFALSFAGQPDRLNGLQVDGSTNNDLFNTTETGNGTIAGFPDLTIPTVESLEEVQVVTAPFDVRFGGFAGGLVNAVTKSGSNTLKGTAYTYFENQSLTGRDASGARAPDFSQSEAGVSVGGPIVHDRLAFFLDAGFRRQSTPQSIHAPGADTTGGADSAGVGIRYGSAVRFRDILRNSYGVDAGDFETRAHRLPSGSLLAKVTAQLGVNSRLEVSHNWFHADQRFEGGHDYGFIGFSSNALQIPLTVNATRLNWTTAFGRRWTNELLLARVHEWNSCVPDVEFPRVEVVADAGSMVAGSAGCGGLETKESIWELTENLGLEWGSHRLTLGMHHELLTLLSAFRAPGAGAWFFDSLDSLEQGRPSRFEQSLPGPLAPEGPRADFPVRQIGFYLQDQWVPAARLTLTAGLRLDVPFLPNDPPQNPELLAGLGINTAVTPSGHALWSPRLGLSYDASGRGSTFLRGGIGLFAGRPAYIWFREAHFNTGLQRLQLTCTGDATPAFTLDPSQQPTQCAGLEEPVPVIAYFDRDFRFPRSLKLSLGVDQRLPWGMVGTLDILYARGVGQFAERDVNLMPPLGTAGGEGGRALYGSIDPATGISEPARRNPAFGPVIEMFNRSGDRAWSLALQLQKRFPQGTELGAAYTYTDARDRQSTPANDSYDNLTASPLDGTWEHPNLRTSIYSRPHKVALTGTFDLPLKLHLGLFYTGFSGDPVTYIVLGDANGDGIDNLFGHTNDNDPVYVPKDAGDITLANPADYPALERIIRRESCLRRQRGRLLERNSCRQPWFTSLDARLTKVLPTTHGQSLELSADVFNLLNLLDRDWGLARFNFEDFGTGSFGRVSLLELVGYDVEHGRGVYNVLAPHFRQVDPEGSRWRLRLSARYTF